ncbi:hypothetical protein [Glycomyces sp. NPDC047010]|uniref:hypothetical protein n=1 Tax=Glycomyces sp. NPDC047010 TaxID=3155023 RepID=UPI0033E8D12D
MGTSRSDPEPDAIDTDALASVLDAVDDHERSLSDVVLGAAAATVLIPLIQTIAVKAGEDLYALLKRRFAERRSDPRSEHSDAGLILIDEPMKAALRVPRNLGQDDLAEIGRLLALANGTDWVLVSRGSAGSDWTLQVVEARPEDGVPVPAGD